MSQHSQIGQITRSVMATTILAAALFVGPAASALAQKGGGKKPPPPPPPAYPYTFTDLGQPVYSDYPHRAYDITEPNEQGELLIVAGGLAGPAHDFATLWEATIDGVSSVGPVPGSFRGRAAVNEAGMLAFYGYSESLATYVPLVDVPGVGTAEFPLPQYYPQAMNESGQVVLAYYQYGNPGFLWTVNGDGTTADIVFLPDFTPRAINDWGLMAGQQVSTESAAIAWLEDGVLHVQALPGLFSSNKGQATSINNFGEVVGFSYVSYFVGFTNPFLWSSSAGLISLNPNSNESGAALDINDSGQVVGSVTSASYGFLWENGTFSDLNTLNGASTTTFRLGSAEAINNAGQIVGRSETYNVKYKGRLLVGATATYLLTPNP